MLPTHLYRGDSDKKNERKLKETISSGVLLTNLCSGGNGRIIFSNTLEQLINNHISIGWNKTHFLSFSTDEQIAFHYASDSSQYEEVYDYKGNWDFAVITFDTNSLTTNSIKEIRTGIYSAQFVPACFEFLPTYTVILIDAVSHLKSIASKTNYDLSMAISNAERDKEWLVLPANPFVNTGELTSKLDTNCISDKRVFKVF